MHSKKLRYGCKAAIYMVKILYTKSFVVPSCLVSISRNLNTVGP